MKMIYSGGWNNKLKESREHSFVYTYQQVIKAAIEKGKKIAFVTLAKPDGYYNDLVLSLYKDTVDIIDSTKQNVYWSSYDGIFLLGGNSIFLKNGLVKTGFSLDTLTSTSVLLGDSAGAYVLSSYFYQSPSGPLRGEHIEFHEGLNPEAHAITIAHKNNPVYTTDILITKVNAFAKEKGIHVVTLNENEQRMLKDGRFIEFDKNAIF